MRKFLIAVIAVIGLIVAGCGSTKTVTVPAKPVTPPPAQTTPAVPAPAAPVAPAAPALTDAGTLHAALAQTGTVTPLETQADGIRFKYTGNVTGYVVIHVFYSVAGANAYMAQPDPAGYHTEQFGNVTVLGTTGWKDNTIRTALGL